MICLIIIIGYVGTKQTVQDDPRVLAFPEGSHPRPESRWLDHPTDVLPTSVSTVHLSALLERIPKNKDKIAILINSQGGCFAQTTIIARKIAQIARRNKAQVWTFAQEWATNAGFMLLSTGDRVFVNKASVVGGLEVGESKLLTGKFGEYVSTVTYAREPSYLSEMNRVEPFEGGKKEEVEAVYKIFSQEAEAEIRKKRGIASGVDLNGFYLGEEAVKLGLADSIDTYHSAFGKVSLDSDVRVIEKGKMQMALEQIRKLNFSN
jgi:ClpP class serine protease